MERMVMRGPPSHPDGKRHGADKRNTSAPPREPSFFSSPETCRRRSPNPRRHPGLVPGSTPGRGERLEPQAALRSPVAPERTETSTKVGALTPGIVPRRRPGPSWAKVCDALQRPSQLGPRVSQMCDKDGGRETVGPLAR